MPTFNVKAPDGSMLTVNAPDGATPQQAIEFAAKTWQPQPGIVDQLKQQAGLTGRYALQGLGDVAGIVGNPISYLSGGRIPKPSQSAEEIANSLGLPQPQGDQQKLVGAMSRGVVSAGTMSGAGNLLAKAPGAIGDLGTWLASQPAAQATSAIGATGGSELARQNGVGPTGQAIAGLAGGIAPNILKTVVPMAGRGVANLIGELGTHTGGKSIQQAAKAGFTGGQTAQEFTDNMRGNVPISDTLDNAKSALANIRQQRSIAYQAGMKNLGKSNAVLDFKPIEDSVNNAMKVSTFTGPNSGLTVSTSRTTSDMQKKLSDLINEWASYPANDFHTAAGFDALKQTIGDLRDSTKYGTPERIVADRVYNAVKNQIVRQAPDYAKTMSNYQKASDLIGDIGKSFSLNEKSSADTAIRKLQSLTRNNVNTNYGTRMNLAQELQNNGAPNLISNLSGQALNTIAPRGLGKAVAGATAAGGLATGNLAAIPLLAAQSPRIMGETAFKVGQGAGLLNNSFGGLANQSLKDAILRGLIYAGIGTNQ